MQDIPKVNVKELVYSYKEAIEQYFNIDPQEFQVAPDNPDYIYYQTILLSAIQTIQQINLERERELRQKQEEMEQTLGFDKEASPVHEEDFISEEEIMDDLPDEEESNVIKGDFGKE